MMNNCAINYGSFKNSHNVMERNFCSTPRKGDAMTPALNFNFNLNGLFQQTMTNAYGYDQENLSHFTRNNNVKKNDVNYLNVNLKKIIKNRIHSKKLKSQKPQLKVKL